MKYFTESGKPKRKPSDLIEQSEMWQERCQLLEREVESQKKEHEKECKKLERVIRKFREFNRSLKLRIHQLKERLGRISLITEEEQ